MNKLLCVALATFLCAPLVGAQSTRFRVGVFLHHSTGERIWGPNGSATSIPQEVEKYNTLHGLTGTDAVVMAEAGWPTDPWSNEWERWHRIFNNAEAGADIRPYLSGSRIVMVKSCFPSSSIVRAGTQPTHSAQKPRLSITTSGIGAPSSASWPVIRTISL